MSIFIYVFTAKNSFLLQREEFIVVQFNRHFRRKTFIAITISNLSETTYFNNQLMSDAKYDKK